jgi:galactose-1-phosphate uridylyltransferase
VVFSEGITPLKDKRKDAPIAVFNDNTNPVGSTKNHLHKIVIAHPLRNMPIKDATNNIILNKNVTEPLSKVIAFDSFCFVSVGLFIYSPK